MIRQLTKCIREYKAPTVWTLVLILAEVAIDVIIPFETANLINEVKAGAELGGIVRVGLVLVLLAMISLVCGGAAGFTGSKAASGFAKTCAMTSSPRYRAFRLRTLTSSRPPRSSRA